MMDDRSNAPSSIETKDDIQQRITSPPQIMRVQTNHIFSMNHHAHYIYHHQNPHPHAHDIENNTHGTNVRTVQNKLPNHTQVSPSTAVVIPTKDTQRSLPNNTSSLTEAGQYYNMDIDRHHLKQAQNRIKDADQMSKSTPFLLPVVCVTAVMVFAIGLFVLYQVHSSDVEE